MKTLSEKIKKVTLEVILGILYLLKSMDPFLREKITLENPSWCGFLPHLQEG